MDDDLLKKISEAKENGNLREFTLGITMGDILKDLSSYHSKTSAFAIGIPPDTDDGKPLYIIATINGTLGTSLIKTLAKSADVDLEERPFPEETDDTITFDYGDNN